MNDLSPKERIQRVMRKKTVDRPPVICPGGMMNSAIVEIMEKKGHVLPSAHFDSRLMIQLAEDVYEYTGFENIGIPFCMTVEAEILGSEIDEGSLICEPKIAKEKYERVDQVQYQSVEELLKRGRIDTISKAVQILSEKHQNVPVIGSLTGPISAAASLVDPMRFLKGLVRDKENSHKVLDYVTDFLVRYASVLVESGADVISIADPTATGEILGPRVFESYALKYLNKLTDGIQALNTPVILHICGKMQSVKPLIPQLHADALSVDAFVSLKKMKEQFKETTTMGNLSTIALQMADTETVHRQTRKLLRDGIDIIAPACGLSTTSPLANIQTMTNTVKGV